VTLNRLADAVDPLGRAGALVPALVISVVAPRLLGERNLADAALRAALSYAAADGVESILKPTVGRHRPSDAGGAFRFHPFLNDGDWHSFPSAHTVHAFALATALSLESRTPWVRVPAYGLAGLVAAQRVYTGQHWTSDVVGSGILAVAIGRAAERLLRDRGLRHVLRPVDAGSDPAR
jgi:membrane-associated phospholipid phosphatase